MGKENEGMKRICFTTGILAIIFLFNGRVFQEQKPVIAASLDSKRLVPITSALCISRPEIPDEEIHWLYVPQSPSELYTEVNYGYLAGQLIKAKYIDANFCPSGGIGLTGYANACGLAAAKSAGIYLQNLYDFIIVDTFRVTGTPPVMLKQLIRYESQFWPGRFGVHFGFGHLTYFGAHTALRWSPYLFQLACRETYGGNCASQAVDDMMIGALLNMMSVQCPTCEYSIDKARAQQSVAYLSHVLLAFCRQSTQIVYNATLKEPSIVVEYPMIWKLTLFNYNVGPTCLYNAIGKAYDESDEEPVTWETFSSYVVEEECKRGLDYVNNITAPYYEFNIEGP